MPSHRFIFNDEQQKNSHGFYLLNSGAQLERFRENPVMLDNHNLDRLIGKWDGLTVEGPLMLAVPVFDDGTEIGKERKGQVERGFLKGASPGIKVLEAEYRLYPPTGQEELFVTKWELMEASTTPLPSNAGALTLRIYDQDKRQVPEEQITMHLEKIVKLKIHQNQNDMPTQPTPAVTQPATINLSAEATVALGLSDGADGTAISAAIVRLHNDLKTERAGHKQAKDLLEAQRKQQAENLVTAALAAGKITADREAAFVKLALADYETTKATLEAIPPKQNFSAQTKPIAGSASGLPAEREKWSLHMWQREDPEGLTKLKAQDPQTYEQICNMSR